MSRDSENSKHTKKDKASKVFAQDGSTSIRRVARQTLTAYGRVLKAQLKGVKKGKDIEAVHQTRVASRRLRAAIDVFGFCYERASTKAIKREIKPVTGALGRARDLDVLLEFLVMYRDSAAEDEKGSLNELIRFKKRQRKALKSDLRKIVRGLRRGKVFKKLDRYAKAVLKGHKVKARSPEEIDLPSTAAPLCFFSSPLLVPRLETVLSWLPEVRATGEPHALHCMRLDAKGLRYAMEPFIPSFGDDFAALYADVKRVQEMLGEIHDCDVWAAMVVAFADRSRDGSEPLKKLAACLLSKRSERYIEFKSWWSPGAELKFRRRFIQSITLMKEDPANDPVEGTGS